MFLKERGQLPKRIVKEYQLSKQTSQKKDKASSLIFSGFERIESDSVAEK